LVPFPITSTKARSRQSWQVPSAVGRPRAYDDAEFERSAETLATHADWFAKYGVKAAIEPIRSAETSFLHTIADAKQYIRQVGHPGVAHINGDVYHMQSEESNIVAHSAKDPWTSAPSDVPYTSSDTTRVEDF
jgi:hydroxypyruvate isomerase